jgi:hypothetical protein
MPKFTLNLFVLLSGFTLNAQENLEQMSCEAKKANLISKYNEFKKFLGKELQVAYDDQVEEAEKLLEEKANERLLILLRQKEANPNSSY